MWEAIGYILLIGLAIAALCVIIPIFSFIATIGSVGLAIYASFTGVIRGFDNTFHVENSYIKKTYYDKKEPAKKGWFFGPCFLAFKSLFRETFEAIHDQADFLNDKWSDIIDWSDSIFIHVIAYVIGFITNIVHWGFGCVLMVFFSLISLVIFILMTLIYYVFFAIVWIIDRIVLLVRGYKNDCPHCNERNEKNGRRLIPNYICPNCYAIHTKLLPNKYGVFNHQCECGCVLGATFLTGKNKLHRRCKICNQEINTEETRSLVLQLLGGTSTGKTVYLAALFHELYENIKNHNATFINDPNCVYELEKLEEYYNGAICEATSGKDAIFYSNIVNYKGAIAPTKLEIIDIPGEVFEGNVQMEQLDHRLSQYSYTNGFLFIIDPFSAGDLTNCRESDTSTAYSTISGEEVFNNFDRYLISQNIAKSNKVIDIPISVIISKADTVEVSKRINMKMIREEFENNRELYKDSFDKCRDEMVKEFLASISQSVIVNSIESRFKNVHYFIVSAMGHSPSENKPYQPWQVFESVEWILKAKDSNLYNKALSRVNNNVSQKIGVKNEHK